MITITSDPSREIKWYFRINRDNRKTFRFFDSGGGAFNFTGYTIVINFKIREGESSNFLQLTSGSGFTRTDNEIEVWLTKAQAATFRDATYFVEFVVTNSSNERNWFTCDGIFHNGKFDGVSSEATDSITIYDGTDTVSVTVTDYGNNNTRVQSIASTATLTPNVDSYDMAEITAQAAALDIAAPTGTPSNGNAFVFRITDNGTARAITFNAIYRAIGSALPTTTVISKTIYFVSVYNSTDNKYDVFPSNQEV